MNISHGIGIVSLFYDDSSRIYSCICYTDCVIFCWLELTFRVNYPCVFSSCVPIRVICDNMWLSLSEISSALTHVTSIWRTRFLHQFRLMDGKPRILILVVVKLLVLDMLSLALSKWTHSLTGSITLFFSMNAFNLKSAKFDEKSFYHVFKTVVAVSHQFHSLFLSHTFPQKLLWSFEIWKQQEEDFFGRSRNLHQENFPRNVMEVAIQNLSVYANSHIVPANLHWWGSFLSNYIHIQTW